jgi:hypothetical protein
MKPRAEKARVDHAPTSASPSAVANGTRPGWYRANFPFFVLQDNPTERQLLVAPGTMIGPVDEPEPVLSELCSIHHRAYDHDLVGVSPDYDVRVSPRLLEDDDGPMLDLLKRFDRKPIYVPRRAEWKAGPRTPSVPVRAVPHAQRSVSVGRPMRSR